MDAERFDDLTRALWASESRRRLLRGLIVLPIAGAAAALVTPPTETATAHPAHRVLRRKRSQRKKARQWRAKQRNAQRSDNGNNDNKDDTRPLGSGQKCVALDQVCSIFGDPCCSGASCEATLGLVVTTCQRGCQKSIHCRWWFPDVPNVQCVKDTLACPGHSTGCCRVVACGGSPVCADGRNCCNGVCCPDYAYCSAGGLDAKCVVEDL